MVNRKLLILAFLFLTSLLVSNIIASKLVYLWGIVLPAAVFIFPITFVVTDTVTEVWGEEQAREIIWLGFIMNILMIVFLQVAQLLPPAPFWEHQQAFETVLGTVPRIVAASLAAYIISQLHDVWAFNYWKTRTKGRHLWLRNNLSTIASQLLDSVIFISLAFGGTVPFSVLLSMIFSQYLVKFIFALLDTPFCYLAVSWARNDTKVYEG